MELVQLRTDFHFVLISFHSVATCGKSYLPGMSSPESGSVPSAPGRGGKTEPGIVSSPHPQLCEDTIVLHPLSVLESYTFCPLCSKTLQWFCLPPALTHFLSIIKINIGKSSLSRNLFYNTRANSSTWTAQKTIYSKQQVSRMCLAEDLYAIRFNKQCTQCMHDNNNILKEDYMKPRDT